MANLKTLGAPSPDRGIDRISGSNWNDLIQSYKRSKSHTVKVGISGSIVYANDSNGNELDSGVAGVDDTRVIQTALDAVKVTGGTLLIDVGTYPVNSLNIKSHSNFILAGVNPAATVLKCKTTGQDILKKNSSTATSNIIIRDLTFDGDNKCNQQLNANNLTSNILVENCIFTQMNCSSPAVYFAGVTNGVIRRCVFKLANAAGDLCAIQGKRIIVEDCDFSRSVAGAGLTSGGLTDAIISRNHFHDFTGYAGVSLENFNDFQNVLISNNTFNATSSNPVLTIQTSGSGTFDQIKVDNNVFYNCVGDIKLFGCSNSSITNNQCVGTGIQINGGTKNTLISNNTITGKRIKVFELDASQISITGNIITDSTAEAIYLISCKKYVITNNILRNCCQGTDNTYDAIYLYKWSNSDQCDDGIISNNVIHSDHTNKPRYCVGGDNPTNIIVVDNRLSGFSTGAIPTRLLGLTGNKIKNNIGFLTENGGTGSINNGSTSATITHGLGYTPTAAEISVVFTEKPTNAPRMYYITSITSAQFTVNVDSDPGASNLDFSWAVRKI